MAAELIAILAVLVLIGAVVGARPYLRSLRAELGRDETIAAWAAGAGLRYSRLDPSFPAGTHMRLPFELFSRGDEQRCENVVSGERAGAAVTAFDFWYTDVVEGRRTPQGEHVETDAIRAPVGLTCALTTFSADCPHLVLDRHSAIDSGLEELGLHGVELESGEFDRTFRIRAAEGRFATELLDPALMQWLLDAGRDLRWEVQRGQILCSGPRRAAARWGQMLDALVGFRARIPPAVYSLHPPT